MSNWAWWAWLLAGFGWIGWFVLGALAVRRWRRGASQLGELAAARVSSCPGDGARDPHVTLHIFGSIVPRRHVLSLWPADAARVSGMLFEAAEKCTEKQGGTGTHVVEGFEDPGV